MMLRMIPIWEKSFTFALLIIDVVCFAVQESDGGLYVCMNTFLGFGREHVERHYRKTGQSVYMHLKRHVKEVGVCSYSQVFTVGQFNLI